MNATRTCGGYLCKHALMLPAVSTPVTTIREEAGALFWTVYTDICKIKSQTPPKCSAGSSGADRETDSSDIDLSRSNNDDITSIDDKNKNKGKDNGKYIHGISTIGIDVMGPHKLGTHIKNSQYQNTDDERYVGVTSLECNVIVSNLL